VLTPWMILVQSNEGLVEYVRLRGALYGEWSARLFPFALLLTMNPVPAIAAVLRGGLPDRDYSAMWLEQMELLVPLLLLAGVGIEIVRRRRRSEAASRDAYRIALAAVFLAVIDSRLF